MTDSNAVISGVIDLINDDCLRLSWSMESTRPATNNPDQQYVAHIRIIETGEAIGLGMSPDSNTRALIEAYRSARNRQFTFDPALG